MWNFINNPSYYGMVNTVGDGVVLGVGYDNFAVTKPLFRFRVQNFYTWHFVISGSGTLDVEDKTFDVKCGDMFFIPPDVKMRYYPNRQDPWEYVWFSLNGETADNYGNEHYVFIHNLPMVADPNVAIATAEDYELSFKFNEKIKTVIWVDNKNNVDFEQNGNNVKLKPKPFRYGESLVVRVAKIKTE